MWPRISLRSIRATRLRRAGRALAQRRLGGGEAGNAERRLREIVGAEREELGALRNLVGLEGSARQLDHGADLIIDLGTGLGGDRPGGRVDARLDEVELRLGGDQRSEEHTTE